MGIASLFKKKLFGVLQSLVERSALKENEPELSAWGVHANRQRHLVIGGCDCTELAAIYGTPLFVVDQKRLEDNYRRLSNTLANHDINSEIYYSYKTNPVPAVLRILHKSGAGAEIISPYELWLAFKLGVPPNQIIYNGPNKPADSLRSAIVNDIKLININSLSEIDKIEKIAAEEGKKANVGVRISTGIGWGAQFGVKLSNGEAYTAFQRMASSSHIRSEAIHFHLGTNLTSATLHQTAMERVFKLMHTIKTEFDIKIRFLDLGGGLGVPTVRGLDSRELKLNTYLYKPYTPPNTSETQPLDELLGQIIATFKNLCQQYNYDPPALLLEPGRVLTSDAEILLTEVGEIIATTNGFPIALVNAGVNIARPLTFEYHSILLANNLAAPAKQRYGLAGPICTPMDFFLKSKMLPRLEVGDLLAIMDAGAYFTSFANDFSLPRPAIIMVHEGKHRLIRNAESFEHLIEHDLAYD